MGNSYRPAVAFAAGRVWLAALPESLVLTTSYQRRVVVADARSCTSCGDLFPPCQCRAPRWIPSWLPTVASPRRPVEEPQTRRTPLFVWADPSLPSRRPRCWPNACARLRDERHDHRAWRRMRNDRRGRVQPRARHRQQRVPLQFDRCVGDGAGGDLQLQRAVQHVPVRDVWTPFSVTQSPPIVGGAAFVEFPDPVPVIFVSSAAVRDAVVGDRLHADVSLAWAALTGSRHRTAPLLTDREPNARFERTRCCTAAAAGLSCLAHRSNHEP